MKNLYQFFIKELKQIYSAEHQIVKALPLMIQVAHSTKLKHAFEMHLEETHQQIQRLKEIEKELKENFAGYTCKVMQEIIHEEEELSRTLYEDTAKDAALISVAQRIEQYEIAVYSCLKDYAKHLHYTHIESLLKETLKEEEHANKKLREIGEGTFFTTGINTKASNTCTCH